MSWRARFEEGVRNAAASSSDALPPDAARDEPAPDPVGLSQAAASSQLFDYIVTMKLANKPMTAKAACEIAYLACESGAQGDIEKLSVEPSKSPSFSRHFDKAIGLLDCMEDQSLDSIAIPGHSRHFGRVDLTYATNLVFESLGREVAALQSWKTLLDATYLDMGPLYTENPHVKANPGERFIPLALYQDGVAFQWDRKDGALGFWFINLATSRRHLAFVIRKRHLCDCGCRGWCSMYIAYSFLSWLMRTMLLGVYPDSRHNGESWGDHPMAGMAGQQLGYRAIVLMVKGDWMEFSANMGFTNWRHNECPCFVCNARGGDAADALHMSQIAGFTPISLPWPLRTQLDNEARVAACETRITVADRKAFASIVGSLQSDARKSGARGRRLMRSFPAYGITEGMRLEPDTYHPDVYAVDRWVSDWPGQVRMTFWDPRRERGVRHNNPLFAPGTGVSVETLAVDELHTFHEGVAQDYAYVAFWRLIQDDPFGVGTGLADGDTHRAIARHMENLLAAWYRDRRAMGCDVSEIRDTLYNVIVGTSLSAKASASGDLLRFVVDLVGVHFASLQNGEALRGAGRALVKYLDITRSAGWRLNASQRQSLIDACVRFRTLAPLCEVPFKPKHHLFTHLVWQAKLFGNPLRGAATWVDEGLNSVLRAVARGSHALAWSRRLIATFAHKEGPTAALASSVAKKRRTG